MNTSWKEVAAQVAARWRLLGPAQKFFVGSLLAGAVVAVFASVLIARHVSYATLFTNLEPDQGSPVVEKLTELKIPYRLSNGGRTIQVPEKDVYALRLKLAGEAAPSGSGSGYEIFDRSRFGMTGFMQQVNYRRAIEGELARTIREMDEVLFARVHLVIPERSVFTEAAPQPSASVVLRLTPGTQLASKQIAGITALVSGSVEGLTSDHVNVLDSFGNLLSSNQQNSLMDPVATARFQMENEVGRSLEERGQSLLNRVVGPDMAVVRVTAELDFERLERESESYDPNTVVRSEQTTEQAAQGSGSESSSAVTNYEVNKTVERVKKTPGNIKRMTVAVTVDGVYESADESSAPNFVPRSSAELGKLAELVKNTVGFDAQRGDQFHIACVQFDRSYLQEAQKEMKLEDRRMLWQTILNHGPVVLAVVLAFFALRMIFGMVTRTVLQAPVATPLLESGEFAAELITNQPVDSIVTSANKEPAPEANVAAAPKMPRMQQRTAVTSKVTEMSRRRPEEAVSLILNMLDEER